LTKAQPKISNFSKKIIPEGELVTAEFLSVNQVSSDKLIDLFNGSFLETYNTCLLGGASEPEYLPADIHYPHHRIIFTQNYVASALHEIAHWCIAGEARRQQTDYGYWYIPDGRNREQQSAFEVVEVKPQALEWIFSEACGITFNVSADNLGSGNGPGVGFKRAIVEQALEFCQHGVGQRAKTWVDVLSAYFQTNQLFDPSRYQLQKL
jgi:elongation factor P hydroxylase